MNQWCNNCDIAVNEIMKFEITVSPVFPVFPYFTGIMDNAGAAQSQS